MSFVNSHQKTTGRNSCPSCSQRMTPFFEMREVPTNSCVLLETFEEARDYSRGDIVLGFCTSCGFICNLTFDERLTEYSSRYEETQGYSPTFQKFHQELTSDLIERYEIYDKDVLEIGCGKGEFLAMICAQGRNRGIGFDPGYDFERNIFEGIENVRVIKDFFSEKYNGMQADLVCCKMTLEHIPESRDLVRLANEAMRRDSDSVLYFLVPNASRILKDCAFEDIYYEHCSYFSPGSLARLCRSCGFSIEQIRTWYADQYLSIEARLDSGATDTLPLPEENDFDTIAGLVETFAIRYKNKVNSWKNRLDEATGRGKIAVWGSGSKAVSFLSAVDSDRLVDIVIDINPHRQGFYMPGSGHQISAPSVLVENRPTAVIIMNSIYESEVKSILETMDIDANVLTL